MGQNLSHIQTLGKKRENSGLNTSQPGVTHVPLAQKWDKDKKGDRGGGVFLGILGLNIGGK